MNYKDPSKDTGKYVNGIYTTKNGFKGLGLNCPKGTRLYNTKAISPIFFMPDDSPEDEKWKMITPEVCQDILPYYAISTHGRIMNVNSGKIMKPNYRPNGYEYYCLAADNCKNGQKKYNIHRIIMKTFCPTDNMDSLQVNHINGNKKDNYINKVMPDGSVQSNLEWNSGSENMKNAYINGLNEAKRVSLDNVKKMRSLRDQGYSYTRIKTDYFPTVSISAIQFICKNITYHDPSYTPRSEFDAYKDNTNNGFKLSDKDAAIIRSLFNSGYKYEEIRSKFYPSVTIGTLSDIVRGKTHNRDL